MSRHVNDRVQGERLAVGLGWFSIGLGLAELASPRTMARVIGVRQDDRTTSVMQAYGAREIANGFAILAQPDRATWLWARVGGDAVDLSSLAAGFGLPETDRARLAAAMTAVAGVTVLDAICARQLNRSGARAMADRGYARAPRGVVRVERVTTINRPIEEVYAFWRNFENLPRFMRHLDSVRRIDERRSHWRARGPAGTTVDWDAEMIEDRENEWIAWRSLEGADVENSGSVRFQHAPGARGTEVRVQLQYRPPAGKLGRTLAWLFGEEPSQQVAEDLHRFKQLMETGEIPLSDGPGLWRAAQPAVHPEELRTLTGVTR